MDITERKITKIAREVSKFTVRTLRAEGVGPGEFDVLHAIRKNPGITQSGVCRITGFDKGALEKAGKAFKTILDILGILEKEWKKTEAYDDKDYNDLMNVILSVRQSARKAKQYQLADEIRDKLGEIGIVIEDTPTGARWKKRGV